MARSRTGGNPKVDNPESPRSGFDWVEAQKRYLDALAALGGGLEPWQSINPWQQALDHWWQDVKKTMPDRDRAFFDHLLQQSRVFHGLADQFGKSLGAMSSTQEAGQNWESTLRDQIEGMKSRAAGTGDPALRGLVTAWQLPLDTWQRTQSFLSLLPGDPLSALKQEPGAGLNISPIGVPGYTKKLREQIHGGAQLWDDYRRNLQEYQAGLATVAADAVQRLQERILVLGSSGKSLGSLRDIYDLWIDCNEAAYAEHVLTEEYARRFGRLVNSLMAFKRHCQELIEEALAAMNMPTRQGMNSVRRHQQEMRRELNVAAAQGQANAESIRRLRDELDVLRRELSGAGGFEEVPHTAPRPAENSSAGETAPKDPLLKGGQ